MFLPGAVGFVPRGQAHGNRPPVQPEAALQRLERARGHLIARLDTTTGSVRTLRGNLRPGTPRQAQQTVRDFLADYPDLFGLVDPAAELGLTRIVSDTHGYQSIHLRQRIGGVPVLGGELRADVDPAGTLIAVAGTLQPGPAPRALRPRISAARALALGRAAIRVDATSIVVPSLLVARLATGDNLVWQVEFLTHEPARWRLLVDAITGEILERRDILAFAGLNRRTFSANDSWILPGTLLRSEGEPPSGDTHADAAHDNAGKVYTYFLNTFGRDSIDGTGGRIESTVHYRVDPSQPYNNAFWNGSQMVYGDGDGVVFGLLGTALDVVGHELTHGITQETAGLNYSGQSGALNEAFSDVFGALIDDANWEIGETVFSPLIAGDALRSLSDPLRYGQPSVWGEYLELPDTAPGDNAGVHANSGIINHIAFTIAEQIGRPKLAQIFYRTLTMKLTSQADFLDARDTTIVACDELAGTNGITADDCLVVVSAFASAGIHTSILPGPMQNHIFVPLITGSTRQCASNPANLVDNSGFEAAGAWAHWNSVVGAWAIQSEGVRSARLNSVDQLLQLIELPLGTKQLTLSFDALWDTGGSGNQLEVSIEDPMTHAALTTPVLVGADFTPGRWKRVTLTFDGLADPSAVRLVFRHAITNGVFYLDNVRLTTDCAAP